MGVGGGGRGTDNELSRRGSGNPCGCLRKVIILGVFAAFRQSPPGKDMAILLVAIIYFWLF